MIYTNNLDFMLQLIIGAILGLGMLIFSFFQGRSSAKEDKLTNFIIGNDKLKKGKDKFNNFSKLDKLKWLFNALEKRKNNK